jgi:disulfide oxidoreductase YuzD
VRRNFYPDFKYLEGLLNWYFGDRVALAYIYRPGGDPVSYPRIVVNGQVVARGKIPADAVVKYLEEMGVERLL